MSKYFFFISHSISRGPAEITLKSARWATVAPRATTPPYCVSFFFYTHPIPFFTIETIGNVQMDGRAIWTFSPYVLRTLTIETSRHARAEHKQKRWPGTLFDDSPDSFPVSAAKSKQQVALFYYYYSQQVACPLNDRVVVLAIRGFCCTRN